MITQNSELSVIFMFLLLIAKCGTGNLSPMKNIFDFPFVKCSFESISV